MIDTLGPQLTHRPQATVEAFDSAGVYLGHLKHNIVDGGPSGLAVDNSPDATQGRVYVTSGNTVGASVIAYPPGGADQTPPPLEPLTAAAGGGGEEAPPAPVPAPAPLASPPAARPAAASAITQRGTLRVKVSGRLAPKRLPRVGTAPIAVTVGGEISTTDESLPPRLAAMRIELNRNGRLDYAGLPTCPYNRIQPGSSTRALSQCRSALVGRGSFSADITLSGQEPYPTRGKLLVFNSKRGRKPVLYGHIYSPKPFATSFVIVFKIQKLRKGTYGTALNAPLPKAMDAWGRLTGLNMTLNRRFRHKGRSHSYLSAGCPAPRGFSLATFSLARSTFVFEDGRRLAAGLSSTCRVRR